VNKSVGWASAHQAAEAAVRRRLRFSHQQTDKSLFASFSSEKEDSSYSLFVPA
jgi:hypothetical protein